MPKISNSASTECVSTDQEAVDAFMKKLLHPMKKVAEELRRIILEAHPAIGEEIAWNAPTFYYNGKLKPFDPKGYNRFIAGYNFYKKDCLRLIFYRGALVKDPDKMLAGEFKDNRKIALFTSMAEVNSRKKSVQKIVVDLIAIIKKL